MNQDRLQSDATRNNW